MESAGVWILFPVDGLKFWTFLQEQDVECYITHSCIRCRDPHRLCCQDPLLTSLDQGWTLPGRVQCIIKYPRSPQRIAMAMTTFMIDTLGGRLSKQGQTTGTAHIYWYHLIVGDVLLSFSSYNTQQDPANPRLWQHMETHLAWLLHSNIVHWSTMMKVLTVGPMQHIQYNRH